MSETAFDDRLTHLPPAAARVGHAFARPRAIAAGCVIALTGAGWLVLGLMASGARTGTIIDLLCRPVAGPGGVTSAALVWLMWCAMALAMMLPSAAPMILTYAEIADTAARKRKAVVSPLLLAAGYATVWFGFAAVAAAMQMLLTGANPINPASASAGSLLSGILFIAAGVYQFSALKHACLRLCQRPFAFFFANWATTRHGVFGLGLRQGLYCLGCCWAMMLLMFATGVMNIVWMAALGAVMTIEKMKTTKTFSHALGAIFIAVGIAFVLSGVAR